MNGFWVKMARADVFDLAIHDQFQRKGYQRRVKMRGEWCSLPVAGKSEIRPITEVRLDPSAPKVLLDTVRGRYAGSLFFDDVYPDLVEHVETAVDRSPRLWLFNLGLIQWVARRLKIDTMLSWTAQPLTEHGIDGLLELCGQYPNTTCYLSGDGGRAYMGDDPHWRFAQAGYDLEWMQYEPPTSDSILTVLMDHADPRGEIGL